MEIRFLLKELDEESGIFSGYASTREKDQVGDVVTQGAFEKSLGQHVKNGTMPMMLWQHDRHQPIGVWEEMKEDDQGLFVRGRLIREVQKGDEAYHLLKAKAIGGMSIGYRVVKEKLDRATKTNYLNEVELKEVSLVTFPCNESATVSDVKAMDDQEMKQVLSDLEERLAQLEAKEKAPSEGDPIEGEIDEKSASELLEILK